MTIPNSKFIDGMHKWQKDVFGRYARHEARFFVLNWHRRSRKTTGILNLFITECCRYPKLIATMVFPFLTEARSVIWDDPKMLDTYLPDQEEMRTKKNESKLHVKFANGSLFRLCGADKPGSLRGNDTDLLDLSEWAQMKREIWEEIFSPIMTVNPRKDFVRCVFFDFTPKGDNHAKETWDNAALLEGWYRSFLPANMSGIIDENVLRHEKIKLPSGVYDQEYECAFITEEERVMITSLMLDELKGINIYEAQVRKLISVDPSIGNDECVSYAFHNTEKVDELILHERDTMKIVGELMLFSQKTKINTFAIESIGADAGKGLIDRLGELGKKVYPVNPGEGALDSIHFLNRRAEMWSVVARIIRDKRVAYPKDMELRRQLTNVHFNILDSNMKLKVEGKESIRNKLGRSPDRADTWVIGLWAQEQGYGETDEPEPRFQRSKRVPSAMAA